MIDSQVMQFRCGECQALFQEDTPVNVRIELWAAWVSAIRCPSCGSKKILMGQSRTLSEDAALDWGVGLEGRIARWQVDGEQGNSAKAILLRMSGRRQTETGHPHDTADLRRCMLLLARFPEWRERMGEMADVSGEWAMFSQAWPMLERLFHEESGPDLDRKATPKTSALVSACAGHGEDMLALLADLQAQGG